MLPTWGWKGFTCQDAVADITAVGGLASLPIAATQRRRDRTFVRCCSHHDWLFTGPGEASLVPEHASVVVETVTKTSTTRKYSGVKQLSSDAGRCLTDGDGLNTAFTGKTASFTVDTKGAGNY